MPIVTLNNRQVLFVHIPKTGGSTIEAWLKEQSPVSLFSERRPVGLACPPQHFHAELLKQIGCVEMRNYSFAIVRNPFERLVSEFFWAHRNKRQQDGNIRVHGIKKLLRPTLAQIFNNWVLNALDEAHKNPFYRGNHMRQQIEFLEIPGLKVHRFEDGIGRICRSIAVDLALDPPPPLHENKSKKTPFDAMPKTVRAIEEFYRNDFKELGYPLPSQQTARI